MPRREAESNGFETSGVNSFQNKAMAYSLLCQLITDHIFLRRIEDEEQKWLQKPGDLEIDLRDVKEKMEERFFSDPSLLPLYHRLSRVGAFSRGKNQRGVQPSEART